MTSHKDFQAKMTMASASKYLKQDISAWAGGGDEAGPAAARVHAWLFSRSYRVFSGAPDDREDLVGGVMVKLQDRLDDKLNPLGLESRPCAVYLYRMLLTERAEILRTRSERNIEPGDGSEESEVSEVELPELNGDPEQKLLEKECWALIEKISAQWQDSLKITLSRLIEMCRLGEEVEYLMEKYEGISADSSKKEHKLARDRIDQRHKNCRKAINDGLKALRRNGELNDQMLGEVRIHIVRYLIPGRWDTD